MQYIGPYKLPDSAQERPEALYEDPQAKVKVGTPSPQWLELVETLRLHRRRLLSMPGVTAVDLGYKIKDRKFTNELALRVHVERKLPPEELNKDRPQELIPKQDQAPQSDEQIYPKPSGEPVLMDVIEASYKLVALPRPRVVFEKPRERSEVDRRRRVDPLVGGISIGSPQTPAGTLGALVWDQEDGSVCILSNWHVLAGDLRAEVGNPCLQPGVFDQGSSTDVVARLKRWSFNRQTDAAIAELNGCRHYSTGEILSMFQTIKDVAPCPYLGLQVHKSGRSSSHSWGFIDGLYFSAAIEYTNGLVRMFEEQIHIAPLEDKPISEPGDSGSVWVANAQDEGYRAVGLHFAGDLPHSSFGEYALANPMSVVTRRLGFSFRPLFLEIPNDDVITTPPPSAQPVKIPLGNSAQPRSVVVNGPSGPGGQPVDDKMGPGG